MLTRPHRAKRGLALSLVAVMSLAAPASAVADQTDKAASPGAAGEPQDKPAAIRLVYDLYLAGLHLATMETTARLSAESYDISNTGMTTGFADSLVRARFESRASGRFEAAGPKPLTYRNFSDTRFGVRELTMTRSLTGSFEVEAEPELEPQQAATIASGRANGTIDPLTASLYSALRPQAKACTEKVRVFDGRRVFDLAYSRVGPEVLEPGPNAVFAGETVKCHLRYVPRAGQSREWKLEETRNPTPPAALWMAVFERDGHADDLILPVRASLDTNWGTALVHLKSIEIGGTPITQAALSAPAPDTAPRP